MQDGQLKANMGHSYTNRIMSHYKLLFKIWTRPYDLTLDVGTHGLRIFMANNYCFSTQLQFLWFMSSNIVRSLPATIPHLSPMSLLVPMPVPVNGASASAYAHASAHSHAYAHGQAPAQCSMPVYIPMTMQFQLCVLTFPIVTNKFLFLIPDCKVFFLLSSCWFIIILSMHLLITLSTHMPLPTPMIFFLPPLATFPVDLFCKSQLLGYHLLNDFAILSADQYLLFLNQHLQFKI